MKNGTEGNPARVGVGLSAYFLRGVAVTLLAWAVGMAVPVRNRMPNIVLIVVDTLRADRLDARVGGESLMPAVNRLAQESCVYGAATAPAPLTMPSVAALLTGLYPSRNGVVSHSRRTALTVASPTLAELARTAGYSTVAVVSNPWLASPATRFDRGFDVYLTKRRLGAGRARLDAASVTDAALAAIQDARRPVFLWVHYIDTHMPYQPPLADAERLDNPSGTSAIVRDYVSEAVDRQAIYFAPPYPPAEIEATRTLYDAAARSVDREVGRLLESIDRMLGRDDTLVIFTADHGESLGDHGLFFAHDFTLYQELTHVPLMLRIPGVAPTRVKQAVSLVDVAPTLCAQTALQCPHGLDGTPLLTSNAHRAATHRGVFSVGPPYRERYSRNPYVRVPGLSGRWSALRVDSTKLLRIPTESGVRWEAYDLRADPGERRNVFDAERDDDAMRLLEEWFEGQSGRNATIRSRQRRVPLRAEELEELRALGYLD